MAHSSSAAPKHLPLNTLSSPWRANNIKIPEPKPQLCVVLEEVFPLKTSLDDCDV